MTFLFSCQYLSLHDFIHLDLEFLRTFHVTRRDPFLSSKEWVSRVALARCSEWYQCIVVWLRASHSTWLWRAESDLHFWNMALRAVVERSPADQSNTRKVAFMTPFAEKSCYYLSMFEAFFGSFWTLELSKKMFEHCNRCWSFDCCKRWPHEKHMWRARLVAPKFRRVLKCKIRTKETQSIQMLSLSLQIHCSDLYDVTRKLLDLEH